MQGKEKWLLLRNTKNNGLMDRQSIHPRNKTTKTHAHWERRREGETGSEPEKKTLETT